jgi:hypothetical protein
MQEKENVLRILEETSKAIKEENPSVIKELSNQTINTASMTQDPDNILVAVIVYSISKILERTNYRELPGWEKFYGVMISSLEKSIQDIKKDDEKKFRKDFEEIRNALDKLSGKLKFYIQDVFRRASINKASRIYEHGISMETTANLLGVTMFELADYAGETGIPDVRGAQTMDVKSRIKIAEDMFK